MVVDGFCSRRLPSILGICCANCSRSTDMQSQIVRKESTGPVVLRDSMVVADNNNYLTSVVDVDSDSSHWSSNFNWTRKAPLLPHKSRDPPRSRSCLKVTAAFLLLILILVIPTLFYTKHLNFGSSAVSSPENVTQANDLVQNSIAPTTSSPPATTNSSPTQTVPPKVRKSDISKHAWLALQKNEAREEKSVSAQFSFSRDKVHRLPCGASSGSECCKLVKSTEVLEMPGCAGIEVPKHECVGGCTYVFLEGNPYTSIPKCQAVRSRKLKFNVTCGLQVKRVTVDVVSRCRCA